MRIPKYTNSKRLKGLYSFQSFSHIRQYLKPIAGPFHLSTMKLAVCFVFVLLAVAIPGVPGDRERSSSMRALHPSRPFHGCPRSLPADLPILLGDGQQLIDARLGPVKEEKGKSMFLFCD